MGMVQRLAMYIKWRPYWIVDTSLGRSFSIAVRVQRWPWPVWRWAVATVDAAHDEQKEYAATGKGNQTLGN